MDNYNHNYGVFSNRTISVAAAMLANLKALVTVMDSTDLSDDYALFVISDHGGQWYSGEDELCNHGCKLDEGNEGFLYVYCKGMDKAEDWIMQDDIAPTISQFMQNAGIPIHATGMPFPMKNNYVHKYMSYRAKEIQLVSHLKHYGVDVELLDYDPYDHEDVEYALDQYESYLDGLKSQLNKFLETKIYWILLIAVMVGVYFMIKPYFVLNVDCLMLFFEILFVLICSPFYQRIEKIIFLASPD